MIWTIIRTLPGRCFRIRLMAALEMTSTMVIAALMISEEVSELVIASAAQMPST